MALVSLCESCYVWRSVDMYDLWRAFGLERIVWFRSVGMSDVARVGGKNASLGEMISNLACAGVRVPDGFATTADAYREFIAQGGLSDRIHAELDGLDVEDVRGLANTGARIRAAILDTELPAGLDREVRDALGELNRRGEDLPVAVRSSATAEDLPDASFAGQQETFLNVLGADGVVEAVRLVFASLFNDRAIAYRVHQGFDHSQVALSAGIQRMVRSDLAVSGVMFTIDTESGFDDVVFLTAAYGLGELVVQGQVNPDEFYVYKPNLAGGRPAIIKRVRGSKAERMVFSSDASKRVDVETVPKALTREFCLSDPDIEALARFALDIESHYGRAMDIEWGKDGLDGELYILQARPETVESRSTGHALERYRLEEEGEVLAEGRSIGQRIGAGPARVIGDVADMHLVGSGDVLITDMTDPDWEPVMKRAATIVTNRGGRTCHAAIIARELGIPAVVGTQDATNRVTHGNPVTVSCAQGDTGFVYDGALAFEIRTLGIETMPELPFKITMNVGNPERAFDFRKLPNSGVGLARLEFIIGNTIGIHPKALLDYEQLPDELRDPRRCVLARPRHRSPVGLQIRRVREPTGGRALRAARGQPDARLPWGFAISVFRFPGLLRAGVPGAQPRSRGAGVHQRRDHDPVRAHPGRGVAGGRAAG